jgi:hypothetical protein
MEPSMNDIDDFNKPLSNQKVKVILIAFAIMMTLYGLSALMQSML